MKAIGRKCFFISLFLLLSFLLSQVTKHVTYSAHYGSDQSSFFNFISDPQNFKKINPTIIELSVSNTKAENFKISYTEHLVQLPLVVNYAQGHYTMRIDGAVSRLISVHSTCFYTDLFCVPSESVQTVTQVSSTKVLFQEDITYTCSWLFQEFCEREVHQQRALIMDNLKRMFPVEKRTMV